jgi:uncharacterized protein with FMN-binding domain
MNVKRAPVVLAATAAGLAATLGFQAHPKAPTTVAAVTTSAPPAKTSSAPSSAKTATGDAVSTRYGNVQLKVTVSGGKITDVQALQVPQSDGKSVEISNFAVPQLRQSALTKQSANVDAVSGATYTSAGYKQALQSALDKAGFATSNSNRATS